MSIALNAWTSQKKFLYIIVDQIHLDELTIII